MNKSLARHKLPKHTEEETNNLISLTSIKEIKFVLKKFLNNKTPHLDVLTYNFYHTFKEKITTILQNFSKK